jgi:quinoprotein glucose dehydrogenase
VNRVRPLGLAGLILSLIVTAHAQDWPVYGGDAAGAHYSTAALITRDNVNHLTSVWTYHTDELQQHPEAKSRYALEMTPVLADGKLVFCTSLDRVIALDPATGREIWRFDPGLPPNIKPANGFVCRGVAIWHDNAGRGRVFLATLDARLIALDLASGKPCSDFGTSGEVPFPPSVPQLFPGERTLDSPPAMIGDVVVVGSAVGDMARAHAPSGMVAAFDARSGAKRWQFDPAEYHGASGANVWSPITVDAERDLVFLPTASPTATFYGGERPGADEHSSSVVALHGSTGELVWAFQTVHHDIWDYDVAAPPTLAMVPHDGRAVPAVIVATKTGFVFVLDRETGKPLLPVEERPVPASDVPGETISPTQPYPLAPPPLVPQKIAPRDAYGVAIFDRLACRRRLKAMRTDGLFTPPSLKGTAVYPFDGGGANWGGGAYDVSRHLFVVNENNLIHYVRLIPRADYFTVRAANPKVEIGLALGTPFAAERDVLVSALGIPCNPPPWGTLTAVDVAAGKIKWRVPLGARAMGLVRGLPNLGGPIITAGGLVFIAATMDNRLRAFDIDTGAELWRADLLAGGQAGPMTYVVAGRQFVVIAAGGHARLGTKLGDAVMAFALP